MDSQKLLLKVAQVATVEQVMELKSIARLVLKDGAEVKVHGTERGIGFGVLDADGVMHHYLADDLQEAIGKLARWKNAPEWANELVLDDDCNLFWYDAHPEAGVVLKKARVAKGVFVGDGFGFEERPVID